MKEYGGRRRREKIVSSFVVEQHEYECANDWEFCDPLIPEIQARLGVL